MKAEKLIGEWVNEYGSKMSIEKIVGDTFVGTYSSTTGETGLYSIVGCFNPLENSTGSLPISIGISWKNLNKGAQNNSVWDESVSSMTGQAQQVGDKIIITVTHVLVKPTMKPDNWESSYIDKLTFVKQTS
jgi:hypothetical protein